MAERIRGLSIGLDLDDTGISRSLGAIKRSFRDLNGSLKTNLNNFKYTEKSVESYEQAIDDLGSTIKGQQKNVGGLKSKLDELTQAGKSHTAEASKIRQEYNKQVDYLNMLEHQLESTSQEFKDFTREQEIASSKWTILGNQLDNIGNRVSSVGDKMRGVGQNLTMGLTVPLTGVGAGALKAAGDYEAAGAQFSQVFGDLEAQAKGSLDEIGKKTGLLPNALRGSFTQMAAFAKTTGVDTEDALDLTTRATMAAADSAAFYDKSIEEVTESLQSYLKGNYENDSALGISSTETTRNAAANKLYGKSFADLSEQQKQLTLLQMVEDGNKLSGALGQASRESDTLATQTSNVKTAFKDFLAEIGKPILPSAVEILKSMSGAVKGASTWFSGLGDGAQKAVIGFGVFLAALGPIITGAGILAGSLGSIMQLLAPLGPAIAQAGGPLAFLTSKFAILRTLLGVLTGPIGITIAIITALGIAFVTAYKKSETFRNVVDGVVKSIKNILMTGFNAVKIFITSIGNQIRTFWQQNGTEIMNALNNIFKVMSFVFNTLILPLMKVVWGLVKTIIISTWNNIKGVIQGALNIILGIVKIFSSLFTGNWKGLWQGIKQVAKGAIQLVWNLINLWFVGKILGTVRAFGGLFKSLFSGIWNGIKNIFKVSLSFIWNTSKNSFNKIFSIGKNIFTSLKNNLSNTWSNIKGIFSKTLTGIYNGTKQRFTNIYNVGKNSVTNLKNSMNDLWNGIKDNTIGKAQVMKDKVTGIFNGMKNGIKGHIDKVKSHIGSMTKDVKGGLNKLIGGVNWVGAKLGMDKIPEIKLSTGTGSLTRNGKLTRDTFATVGDKGRGNGPGGFRHEMIRYPNGKTVLTPNRDTKTFLPKGSQVINGQDTYNFLNSPRFAKGTGKPWYSQLGDAVGKGFTTGVDVTKDVAGKTIKGAKNISKQALDAIGDVYDYVSNPGKLVDKVLKSFGVDFSFVKGDILSGMINGMYKKLKSSVKALFTTWLDDGGNGGDASSFMKFPKTTPYSPNGAVPGYPSSFNGGRHYGIDYATPVGTVLKAPTSGTVTRQHNHGGGLVAKLVSGKFAQFFLHLSEVLKTGRVNQGDAFAKTGNSGAWTTGPHLHVQVEKGPTGSITNTNTVDPEKFYSGVVKNGKNTMGKDWSSEIRRAAKQMKVSVSNADVNSIMAQIMRESSGNQNIVQSSSVWDVNTASGNPAQGLLQYIPQTFRAYAVKGHTNIRSGYDQLLAFFNNSNWRRDNPGGRSGWGPTGSRRFATGGLIKRSGWYNIAEGGYPEWVIPTDPSRRSEAMQMIAMAANQIQGNATIGNKRPSQLTGGLSTTNDNALLLRMMQQQQEQIALLAQIVQSNQQIADKDFTIDKYEHKKQVFEGIDDYNRQKSRKNQFRPSFA
ncbi:peptidoglycan DD-metalloendopeptidase family protein [Macrococcus armenti]|uniref:peptidoglycan DD-metalloendopeptidase family protein n=1 Tax=Macrococcus armenti TaxID=2875764 RepID=UPI001CCF9583|nr:peptidoglycan DD-metalloendopeptidase family protein [Macrococcus armenti]UBH07838.1 peptidoglycan DD-metalloendopeptidase family protein [Macrococcus armenti]